MSETNVDRGIGPEKLSVRVFREIFAQSALKGGHLKEDLDAYLEGVLRNSGAKRTDKTYARKIYADLIRLAGGNGLPEWAKKPLTNGAIQEEPVKADERASTDTIDTYIDPIDTYIDPNEISLDDITDVFLPPASALDTPDPHEQALQQELSRIMTSYVARTRHPFVERFCVGDQTYVAVGTFVGNILRGEHAGKKLNVNFTVNPYRTRRDIPEDILVHNRNGRAISHMQEDERGCRRFLFIIRHHPGRKIRFWTRIGEKDYPGGGKYVVLTTDGAGWREVTRSEF